MNETRNHPGRKFGAWLKAKRQAKGIIARIFAGQVWLSSSQYAEAEVGVVRWIGTKQERIIPILLDLADKETTKFTELLKAARGAVALTFDNIFSREEMRPVRAAHAQGKQMTKEDEDRLLDIVFQPLPA